MYIFKVKLPFYPPCKAKCRLQNGVSTNSKEYLIDIKFDICLIGVAKFDTTHEPNTINSFINRSWVEAKRIRVIFRSTRLTRLVNGLCLCSTCKPI